ncbi:hypothetical protein [Vibrio quintilis]|uniref:Alpha/beta hydrolase family protein n=1 Tax=Vibrio quintilis TaxID=1117707 RepID=A0A1M7Z017_9VIBR|nr:hypothetical protein [Vibrio quintilis]SHO58279.1 hypothetical protein VQ7734_04050 [Vibrio quintilis]
MKKIIILMTGLLFALNVMAKVGVFPKEDFDKLSYGLYWFGSNNQYEKAGDTTKDGSSYYDPSKPTLILIHGWQPFRMNSYDRFVFHESGEGSTYPDIDLANLWISQGYNIGVFYWDQFADEANVDSAEAKIWTATGKHNMRWKDGNGDYHDGPDKNVTELLLSEYLASMAGYQGKGSDIRIAGHSLGNQLALRLTEELAKLSDQGEIAQNLVPQRVSLLDAFYSNFGKSYLNSKWVGEVARDIVKDLKKRGVAIDSYRTSTVVSTIFAGDENPKLHNSVAFVEQKTKFFNQTQVAAKHSAAIWLYLWSIIYPTPSVTDNTLPGLSATSTNAEVKQWMATTDHLIQIEGGTTKEPQDNVYKTTSAL